jgi:hypothetical protein
MQKLFYFMVAWKLSRWVDEHETVLYKHREPLTIQAVSIWLHSYSTTLPKRGRVDERGTLPRKKKLLDLHSLINIKMID